MFWELIGWIEKMARKAINNLKNQIKRVYGHYKWNSK